MQHQDADRTRVECSVDDDGAVLVGVRFYPDSADDVVQLLSIEVLRGDAAGRTTLRKVVFPGDDPANVVHHGYRHFEVNGQSFYVADSADARFELAVQPEQPADTERYLVRITLLVLDRVWLASFRGAFLEQLRNAEAEGGRLAAEVQRLSGQAEQLESLSDQLRLIRMSRIWRLAEAFRNLFYGRLLAGFPRLRSRLLAASRKGVRRRAEEGGQRIAGALSGNEIQSNPRDDAYQALVLEWERDRPELSVIHQRVAEFRSKPLVSVVMPVFNTPADWLGQAVESVLGQSYENFELCICDDGSTLAETRSYLDGLAHPRVRLARLATSGHISAATNAALEMASGDYVAFMDHDDLLDRDALFHVCREISDYDADIVYSDEDYIDQQGRCYHPNFKPDYSPDLLLSHNYMTHFLVVRKSLLDQAGPLDSRFDGAQDYDLVLRLTELAASVVHLPRVLYHWRQSPRSSSLEVAAKPYVQARTRQLLEAAMERRGIAADVYNANLPHFFYTRRRLPDSPSVSIVLPFRDEPALLEKCLNSILRKTTYTEYEIIGVDNQSRSPLTFELMDAYRDNPRITFVEYDQPFNFPALVNFGASRGRGEYLVLINNDVEIITWNWIEELLAQAVNESTGAVGGKLFYPDNTIQHAGIVVGIDGYAGHGHKHFACHSQGYGNRLNLVHNVSAVTGAFMMVRRSLFEAVGGFDAETFPVACNDVDFCLRLMDAGYWNVFTPHAQAYHLESASRGYEMTEEKRKRFEQEKARFVERHGGFLEQGDPFYSPHLSLATEAFMIRGAGERQPVVAS